MDNIISYYSKAQAVADGEQIEVPDDIREVLNVKARTYITVGLWGDVEYGSDDPVEAEAGTRKNIISLVAAASRAFRAGDTSDMMRTNIEYVRSDGRTFTVWGVIDGDGVTLMYPEDY